MAQDGTTAGGASYTLDNVTFPVGRTKLQSIFDAIRSTNIGNDAPDLVAGQFWIDNNTPSTTVWTMYFYDGTDSIQFATIDTINNTVNFIDSTFDLINDTTPELGGDLSLNSNDITGTGNIDITGNVSLTGTVDGRDVATDGTKLDGIEASATADQSDAEIKTAYENNSNTNAFTDAEKTKLSGIEASATANPNAIDNVVDDTTPQLGGDLDLNSSDITGTGNINITGTVTATSFSGDGSSLTGVASDVVDDTTPQLGGNLESNGNNILFDDSTGGGNNRLKFGADVDLQIYHNGTDSIISDSGTGNLRITSDGTAIELRSSGEDMLVANKDGSVDLYYDNSKKFETTSTGVTVTGTLTETSSIEYKENVQPLEFNEAIYNVNAVKYDRKDGSQRDEVGVIAEDLYEILPDLVQTKEGKPESVKYTKLTMYLLEALKKQNEEIQELKKRLN